MAQNASTILDLIAPQFAGNAQKSDFITLSRDRINKNFYGFNYELAVALNAAHMMTLADSLHQSGEAGSVSSKREGDLSISFTNVQGKDHDDLVLTQYGRRLAGLRRGSGAFIGVTGGGDVGY